MAHTHQTYTPKPKGTTHRTTGSGHGHRKSRYPHPPVDSGTFVDSPGGSGTTLDQGAPAGSVHRHKLHAKKAARHKGTTPHNTSDAATSGQGDYAGQGAFGGAVFAGSPPLHRSKRHKGAHAAHRAGKSPGHGHTHKKGSGATGTGRHSGGGKSGGGHHGGGYTHTGTAQAGHDSRNYTPAPPHALAPLESASPLHPHKH